MSDMKVYTDVNPGSVAEDPAYRELIDKLYTASLNERNVELLTELFATLPQHKRMGDIFKPKTLLDHALANLPRDEKRGWKYYADLFRWEAVNPRHAPKTIALIELLAKRAAELAGEKPQPSMRIATRRPPMRTADRRL